MAGLLLALLGFAAFQAEEPGYYTCELNRPAGGGTLTVAQSLPTADAPSVRKTWWMPSDWVRGTFFSVEWEGDRPDATDTGQVVTFFFVFDRRLRARIVIRSIGADGSRRGVLARPFSAPNLAPAAHIPWPLFRDAARGATALEIVVMREDNRVSYSARIAARDIAGLETAVAGAQAGFDARVAARDEQCAFYHISPVGISVLVRDPARRGDASQPAARIDPEARPERR